MAVIELETNLEGFQELAAALSDSTGELVEALADRSAALVLCRERARCYLVGAASLFRDITEIYMTLKTFVKITM